MRTSAKLPFSTASSACQPFSPYPLPALSHRLVRQPDNGERRQAGGKLHLHVHRQSLNTLERHRPYMGHHAPTSLTINANIGCMKL